jgi:hypothetical protein
MPGISSIGNTLSSIFGKAAPAALNPISLLAGPVLGAIGGLLSPDPNKVKGEQDRATLAAQNQYGIDAENRKATRLDTLRPDRKMTDLSKNMPQMNDLLQRLVMGLGKESFGGDRSKDWGIDWTSLFSGLQNTTQGDPYKSLVPPSGNMGGGLRDGSGGRIPYDSGMPPDVSQYGQAQPAGGQGSMLRMGTVGGANPDMYASALMKKYGMEA